MKGAEEEENRRDDDKKETKEEKKITHRPALYLCGQSLSESVDA